MRHQKILNHYVKNSPIMLFIECINKIVLKLLQILFEITKFTEKKDSYKSHPTRVNR